MQVIQVGQTCPQELFTTSFLWLVTEGEVRRFQAERVTARVISAAINELEGARVVRI